MQTALYSNVNSDPASSFDFSKSIEAQYLSGIFGYLKQLMGADFEQFHFYVFSGVGNNQQPASRSYSQSSKVLIYLSDELSTYPDHLKEDYKAIFKCYLPFERQGDPIFSFPLGYAGDVPQLEAKTASERSYSAFFSGCLNLNRLRLYRELTAFKFFPFVLLYLLKRISFLDKTFTKHLPSDLSDRLEGSYIKFTGYFRQKNLSGGSYSQMLNDSKIVLCPKGFHSSETFRHYEAMRQGAVLLSERLPDTAIYQGCPAVQIKNWKDGIRKIKALMSDSEQLDKLSRSSLAFWEEKWTESAVAQYMFSKLIGAGNK